MKPFELEVWFSPYAFLLVKIYATNRDRALETARYIYPQAHTIGLFDKEYYDAGN